MKHTVNATVLAIRTDHACRLCAPLQFFAACVMEFTPFLMT
jgi:hypothetical protein